MTEDSGEVSISTMLGYYRESMRKSISIRRVIILLILAISLQNTIYGDNKKRTTTHAVFLDLSFANPHFLDKLVSPLHNHGVGGGFDLGYRLKAPHFGLNVAIGGKFGGLFSKNAELNDSENIFVAASMIIDAVYRLPVFESRGWLLLGMQLDYRFQFFQLLHIDSYDWSGSLSLSPLIGIEYEFKRGTLVSSLAFSLLSIANRPPWTIIDDEIDLLTSDSPLLILFRGEIVSIDRYAQFDYKIHWNTRLSSHLTLITGGTIHYIITTMPQRAAFLTACIDVGIRYEF